MSYSAEYSNMMMWLYVTTELICATESNLVQELTELVHTHLILSYRNRFQKLQAGDALSQYLVGCIVKCSKMWNTFLSSLILL